MSGSHPSRWFTFLVFGALTAFGCVGTTDTGQQSETGSLSVDLVLADGIEIDEVDWQITGNGMDMSGSIDVTAPGSTASVEVFGLPPGAMDYTVTLTATSNDEQVTCEGSAPFNVEVGQSTDVMVMLNCKKPRTLGGVRVNGKFNICTQLTKAVVSPLQTSVGNDISLSAQAFDEEGDAIRYIWTGTGGSIADPSAASTTYTCQDVGNHTVMIMVTDDDVYCRMATWTIPVTCVEGDGGDLCEDVVCEDDGNECTETACNPANGACETSNVADGTACDGGAGTCSGGQCVEVDLCEGVDCNDDNECTADACNPADGTCSSTNVDDGTPCNNDEGVCSGGSCVDVDLCEGVVCDDTGNECTVAMCNNTTGECDTMNVADGTACNGGAGACSAGVCIDNNPCQGVDCTSDNDCVQDGTCDPADGLCDPGDPQPADTACDLAGTDDGFCDGAGACVACNADAQCPDDGNECTAETCTSNACSTSPVADGTMCDNDMGVCDQGVCVPANLCEGVDCSDGNECTQDLCDSATGDCSNPAEADGSQCTCPVCGAEGVCDMGVCIDPCDGVDCSDGNQCTADLCNVGVCSNPNVGPGAGCDQDGGNVCDGAGTCVECISADQCPGGGECMVPTCESNSCGLANAANGTSCGDGGTCNGGECVLPTLVVAAGSGSTTWRAEVITGTDGCYVFSPTLQNFIPIDVSLTLDVVSDGANNLTIDYNVDATNSALPFVVNTSVLGDLTVNTAVAGATPTSIFSGPEPDAIGLTLTPFLLSGTGTLQFGSAPTGQYACKGGLPPVPPSNGTQGLPCDIANGDADCEDGGVCTNTTALQQVTQALSPDAVGTDAVSVNWGGAFQLDLVILSTRRCSPAGSTEPDTNGQACPSGLTSDCPSGNACQGQPCECVGGGIVVNQDDCTFTTEGADIPFDVVLE